MKSSQKTLLRKRILNLGLNNYPTINLIDILPFKFICLKTFKKKLFKIIDANKILRGLRLGNSPFKWSRLRL